MDSHALSKVLSDLEPTIKRRYSRCLSKYSRRFDVDDLFQVISMKAHMARDSIRAETPEQLRNWILTVARTSLLTAIEAEQAQKRDIRLEQYESEAIATTSPPKEQADISELNSYLRLAPSEKSEAALRMRYLDGESYAEIGRKLGVTENAVRLLVSRGLKAIRGAVKEEANES